jgi:hypothetical protein
MAQLKVNTTAKALLGPSLYTKIEKHICLWEAEYETSDKKLSYYEFMQAKHNDYGNLRSYKVFYNNELVTTIKATSVADAILRTKEIFVNDPTKQTGSWSSGTQI